MLVKTEKYVKHVHGFSIGKRIRTYTVTGDATRGGSFETISFNNVYRTWVCGVRGNRLAYKRPQRSIRTIYERV